MKLRSIILRLSLVIFGLLLGAILTEITLRYIRQLPKGSEFENLNDLRSSILGFEGDPSKDPVGPSNKSLGHIIQFHPNNDLIYDLRPNLDVQFQGVSLTTNSCGMRNKELPILKAANTLRIALIGDSFAFGWGVKIEESFGAVLEKNLNRLLKGTREIEVLNFGVPGYSTVQEVALFKDRVLGFDPDIVLVYFVENDFDYPFFIRDPKNQERILPSFQILKMAEQAIRGSKEAEVPTLNLDANKAIQQLAEICQQHGIRLFLTINPKRTVRATKKKLWAVKSRPEINYFDLTADLTGAIERENIDPKTLRLPDDPHPNALKHRILGDILTPHFMNSISAESVKRN